MLALRTLRTPDECFAGLTEYPFRPHYAVLPDGDGGSVRMHYVDEGPTSGPAVVLLHGNPTWSYVWRNVVPAVAAAGYRAIAPDLIGLGRSDKPTELADFTVARHVEWVRAFLFDVLALERVTLVVHDWGGTLGLRVLGECPERIERFCLANSGMFLRDPTEPVEPEELVPNGPWAEFQEMVRVTPNWEHWNVMQQLTRRELPAEVIAAYRAPYPDERYLMGNRQFTQLLATTADDPQLPANWRAWQTVQRFERPFLTIVTETDPICGGAHKRYLEHVPGAQGQPHHVIPGGSHFFQEDAVDEFNDTLVTWPRRSIGASA